MKVPTIIEMVSNKSAKATFSDDEDDDTGRGSYDHKISSWVRFRTPRSFTEDFIQRGSKLVIPIMLFIFLLMLLIWDLKTTSILSEIIHDDHSDKWEPMDQGVLQRWFSPIDLCMLKLNETGVDVRTYRAKNCSKLQGEQRLFCGIGSSLGKSCLSPLSERSFFTSRLIGILGDPDNKILKTTMRRVAAQKKAVIFIGDVISKQNQEAMVCELMRTDRITFTGGPHSASDSTVSEFGIKWRDHPELYLNIIFMHLAHITDGRKRRRKLTGMSGLEAVLYPVNIANDNSSVYAQGGPSMTLASATAHMERLRARYPAGVIVIANIGVWYNSREKYRKELPTFMRWLNELGESKKNSVFFRETAAQHWNHTGKIYPQSTFIVQVHISSNFHNYILTFDSRHYVVLQTANGYFTVEENNAPLADSSCVPIADSRGDLDWRNRDAKFILDHEKLRHINIVPFRDVTAPLHDMHPDGYGSKDCTRYCHFPQMWQSVWSKLNDITNRTLA